jgi:DNA-binding MarR family transcriptional regulator
MDPKDIRTLKILEKAEQDYLPSQRDLARELNISLGLVNSFVKRLVKKGYFKITHTPKNRLKYILTPKGVAEKTQLTYEYIQHSYKFYKDARQKLRVLFSEFESQGISRIVFYGASDLAEIAYVSLLETPIKLVAVVDDQKIGKKFIKFTVADSAHLREFVFDRILITTIDTRKPILEKISAKGISLEKIVEIN